MSTKPQPQAANNSSCVLYLGAIPYNWDVEIIKSVVCGSGPVVDVRCMMDNASKNKGFCFVEYATPDAAARALQILSKIKIEGRKKLRIELSKEGLRNPVPGQKPELQLNRNFLPSNVILPQEMLTANPNLPPQYNTYQQAVPSSAASSNSSGSTPSGTANNPFGSRFAGQNSDMLATISSNPQLQQMVSQMISNGMDMTQIGNVVQQFNRQQSTAGSQANGSSQFIPTNLSMASQFLPLPQQSQQPIYAKDKVSETLATIPPGILIELLAKLKLIVSGPSPNYAEAAQILHSNPKLAVAAAQSLLLMGVVDLDVINQSMSAQPQATPAEPAVAPMAGSSAAPPTYSPFNPTSHQSTPSPASTQQAPATTPSPVNLDNVNSDWKGLPRETINKLMHINEQEASLIVQVLKLTPQQIDILPDNERVMANQIRAQYL
ncbi:hypothetical protein KL919_002927 [Ogataea angusta]|nr:hypothetical protein KL919_002927 [Ogataea angusta]